jgi:hypothetical protein
MEAKYITLGDLKKNGFVLSKAEAQEFAPLIREASHNGGDEEIIYPGEPGSDEDTADKDTEFRGDGLDHSDDESDSTDSNESTTGEIADANPKVVAENATTEDDTQVEETPEVKAEHWKAKAKRLREAGLEERAATQEDIDANPESGLKVGDVGEFPIKQA